MLTLATDLSKFTLGAGEPFLLQVQLQDKDGAVIDPVDRAFAVSIYEAGTRMTRERIDGVVDSDARGKFLRFEEDGLLSDSLYGGPSLRVELDERLLRGRDRIADAALSIGETAASLPSLASGLMGVSAVRMVVKQAADGSRTISLLRVPWVPKAAQALPELALSAPVSHPEGNSGTSTFNWTLTLDRKGSTAAIPYSWAVSGVGDHPADVADFGGAYPSGSGTFAPGETSKTITVLVAGDTAVEPDETFGLSASSPGLVSAWSTGTIANDDTGAPPPIGFALNGSTNPALKAMLASKQGIIVEKGDSVTAGAGGAVTANGTSSDVATQCTGARPYRTSNVIAGLMTTAGYPAFDNGWCGDGHLSNGYVSRATFDDRLGGTPLGSVVNEQRFTGGGAVNGIGPETFTLGGIDTFELVVYNIGTTLTLLIDGAAPVSVTSSTGGISGNAVTIPNGSGFTRVVAKAASVGSHVLSYAGSQPAYIRGVRGYNSAAPGIHFINHAAAEATAGQQASTGSEAWFNLNSITFDAPKLTIIRVGLNDAYGGSDTSGYTTAVQAMIDTAKAVGSDVLVLWSNAANPTSFASVARQDSYRDAASAVAASSGVAFGDIRAAMGDWTATGARTADGIVHPNRGYHADIGAYIWSCIQAMAA